jgi:serine/threonine protein phosphatase PrpC
MLLAQKSDSREVAVKVISRLQALISKLTVVRPSNFRAELRLINKEIYQQSKQSNDSVTLCTLAGLVFTKDSLIVINIGNTRVYRFRAGSLIQLSQDHCIPVEQDEGDSGNRQFVLPSAIGRARDINFVESPTQDSDVFLICSDGFYNKLSDSLISEKLSEFTSENSNKLIKELVDIAKQKAGDDSATAISVIVKPSRPNGVIRKRYDAGRPKSLAQQERQPLEATEKPQSFSEAKPASVGLATLASVGTNPRVKLNEGSANPARGRSILASSQPSNASTANSVSTQEDVYKRSGSTIKELPIPEEVLEGTRKPKNQYSEALGVRGLPAENYKQKNFFANYSKYLVMGGVSLLLIFIIGSSSYFLISSNPKKQPVALNQKIASDKVASVNAKGALIKRNRLESVLRQDEEQRIDLEKIRDPELRAFMVDLYVTIKQVVVENEIKLEKISTETERISQAIATLLGNIRLYTQQEANENVDKTPDEN